MTGILARTGSTAAVGPAAVTGARAAVVRRLAAVVLCLHGIIHLLGFLSAWRLAEIQELPYSTTVLGGVDIGDVGVRVLGAGWLAAAVVVTAGGVAVWMRASRRRALVAAGALLSLPLCLLAWPEAAAGVLVNLVVLAVLLVTGLRTARR